MLTLSYRTLVAFFAGVTLTIAATFTFQAWRADAWPGDTDTTFVPVTPCRLVDTRPVPNRIGPHDAFGINDTKNLNTHGTNGDCTIPHDATGLSLNITAIGATAPTFLTIWPDGPRPGASSLNPFPGQPPTPNAVNTLLSGSGTFQIYNLQGSLNVVVDVNGYYTKTSLKDIDYWISDLYLAQPFVETAYESVFDLTQNPAAVVTVTITAPHDGHVTVNSTASVDNVPVEGSANVSCVIVESNNIPDAVGERSESGQIVSWPNGGEGSLSGTRTFSIADGATVDYALACMSHPAGGHGAANLTAIFTPSY